MIKRIRRARVIVVRFLVVLLICIATIGRGQDNAAHARTITDLVGRNIVLPEKVERIVALGPGTLRLVAYLGAVDRIVGIEDMERRMTKNPWFRPYASVLDEQFFSLPIVGPGGPGKLPDFERVMMCRPDVIIAVSMDIAQVNNMQAKIGVPVVYLSYGALGVWREEARKSLSLLGDILGCRQRAKKINAYIARLEKELQARTGSARRGEAPTAYFGGISFKGAHGLTSTESGYPPARMVNALNPADELDKTGHLFVDEEQILVWNPDVVFIDIGSKAILEQDFEKRRGFYRLLKAARSGRVYSLLPHNYYNTNIELALLNACFIGKTLYPEQFADLDVQAKADEILKVFLGKKMDTDPPAYGGLVFPEDGPIQWSKP